MALKNTTETYGWLAKLLHWAITLLLIGLVYAGLTFTGMERGPERSELAALHKSVALLLLFLMTVRLIWKFMNAKPADPEGSTAMQKAASKWMHRLLYAAVYLQLTIGLLVAGMKPISFFGLFDVPPFLADNEELHEQFEELHEIGWIILVVLVVLHVLAALHHHFIAKNDVLKRMTSG